MKKYLSMIAFVMMAMVAFTLQSCGDDDDDNYQLETSLKIYDRGPMTEREAQQMVMAAKKTVRAYYPSEDAAENATRAAAYALRDEMETSNQDFGTAEFTFTLKCKEVSDGEVVSIWYVKYDGTQYEKWKVYGDLD